MQINLNEVAKNQLAKRTSSHPEVQEYHHTLIQESEGELKPGYGFLELTVRNEGFKAVAHSLDDVVHF